MIGGVLEREITYSGETAEDIEKQIEKDRSAIKDWMEMGFVRGSECFDFNGFMLKKKHIAAIEITEADY